MIFMIKRLAATFKKNKLYFIFIIAVFSVTVLICSVSFGLWYMNVKNILNDYLSESVETQQNDVISSLSSMERSLNKTTYQIMDMNSVYNIISGTSATYAEYSAAGSAVQNLISAYTGLQYVYIINEKNMRIFNQELRTPSDPLLSDYVQPEELLLKSQQGKRMFSAPLDNTILIYTTHDFRGYDIVYLFEKKLLFSQLQIFNSTTYETGLYYQNEPLYVSDAAALPEQLSASDALPSDMFLYTRDNYSILTGLTPSAVEKWYEPFMRQMLLFSIIILIAGISAITISSRLFDRFAENYIDTLLLHSRQHHHTAVKATIQKGVRNQYISPSDQEFLNDYFNKIQYKELFCMLIQLDRISSLLLSSSYKEITIFIQKIKQIFENHLQHLGTCIMLDFDFDTVGIILALPEIVQDTDIAQKIAAARVDVEKYLSLTVTIALTDSLTSTQDILYTFAHLNKLKKYRFFTGYNSTITDKNEITANDSAILEKGITKKLISVLVSGDMDLFRLSLTDFFNYARQTSCENARRWILDLTFDLLKHSPARNNATDIISELSQADTIENQFDILEKYFIQNTLNDAEKGIVSNDEFRQKVLEIIETNYGNIDLNLGYLANELHISTVYAGKKFKTIFGETFNTYLSEYRIRAAANLLKADDCKMTEIAKRCGFSSVGYFNKIFKKITNMTPSDYRKNS